jgi:hypothetical protein
MAAFIGIVILVALIVAVVAFVRFIWKLMFAAPTTHLSKTPGMTAEEEGNVHSGPYGYSPNTAYPETQYGSLFDPDAEWNHEEQ